MKKIFLIILSLLFLAKNSFTEKIFSFELALAPTIKIGYGYEYVFTRSITPNQEYRLLSKLDWPLMPSPAFNISANLKFKTGFNSFFSTTISIPSAVGRMEDIDFQNDTIPTRMTNFSSHKTFLKKSISYKTFIGWQLPITKKTVKKNIKIYTEPIIGFTYFLHQWLAQDGYTQYPIYDLDEVRSETKKIYFTGKAVQYTQKIYIPNIGILFKFDFNNLWQLTTLMQVSPQIIAICIDDHFNRNIIFKDLFFNRGFSIHFNIFAERKISNFFYLFFKTEYSAIKNFNGSTIKLENNIITAASPEGFSGTALYLNNFSLGIKFKLKK